jgi:hypothetical protein
MRRHEHPEAEQENEHRGEEQRQFLAHGISLNKIVGPLFVMPGLVPGIHAFAVCHVVKTWMAGTSPAMTRVE